MPAPIFFMIVITILSYILLKHTPFGRYLYAIGGNEYAAIASGIKVKIIKIVAYLILGAMSGFAGVVLCSRLNSGIPACGVNYEFDAIIAAIYWRNIFFWRSGKPRGKHCWMSHYFAFK